MGRYAIRVEGLGKQYRIGGPQESYKTLRDSIADALGAPFRRASSLLRGQAYGASGLNESIWALKDISFEVQHGEVVGIIGRNGAGKSTLLKVLSRITEPTEGEVRVRGRVGSLLEVGTGFHEELTGRENVFLNGAILGMPREEIQRKFDEIVDFAGVEKFIDTPVKHYSSGMRLRLGFAVAAHLEPDILVIDEVLAVGDAEFQKKCLGKMEDVAGEGRTVLFVSHNMAAVQNLCSRGILLKDGRVIADDSVSDVIAQYLYKAEQTEGNLEWEEGIALEGVTELKLHRVTLLDHDQNISLLIEPNRSFSVELEYTIHKALSYARVGIWLTDQYGTILFDTYDSDHILYKGKRDPGRYMSTVRIEPNILLPGRYYLTVHIDTPNYQRHVHLENIVNFTVADDISERGYVTGKRRGVIKSTGQWETHPVSIESAHTSL